MEVNNGFHENPPKILKTDEATTLTRRLPTRLKIKLIEKMKNNKHKNNNSTNNNNETVNA